MFKNGRRRSCYTIYLDSVVLSLSCARRRFPCAELIKCVLAPEVLLLFFFFVYAITLLPRGNVYYTINRSVITTEIMKVYFYLATVNLPTFRSLFITFKNPDLGIFLFSFRVCLQGRKIQEFWSSLFWFAGEEGTGECGDLWVTCKSWNCVWVFFCHRIHFSFCKKVFQPVRQCWSPVRTSWGNWTEPSILKRGSKITPDKVFIEQRKKKLHRSVFKFPLVLLIAVQSSCVSIF